MRTIRNEYQLQQHAARAESIGEAFARADQARERADRERKISERRRANRKPAARALRALADMLGV